MVEFFNEIDPVLPVANVCFGAARSAPLLRQCLVCWPELFPARRILERLSAYCNASRSEVSSSNISHSITDSGKVP